MEIDRVHEIIPSLIESLLENHSSQHECESMNRYKQVLNFEPVDRLPITYSYPVSPDARWQPFPNRYIYQNPAVMFYNELVSAWDLHITDRALILDDLPVTIRPNWGTVTVASLLGIPPEQRDDQTPWIRRRDENITLEDIGSLDVDIREYRWIQNILETYEYYHEVVAAYPKFGEMVTITLPDLQGPFDTLEQIMGEQLFIDMVLEPERVKESLLKVARLQKECIDLFQPYCTEQIPGYSHQHGTMLKGNLLIRNDSVVMISPRMYEDIVAPGDIFLMKEVGGGAIHSCGKIDHATDVMFELEGIQSFDLGQSYLNDMDRIYRKAKEKKIPLIRVQPDREELISGSILERYPTGVTLTFRSQSRNDAIQVHEAYKRAVERRRKK
ncbi:MAG: uroporphyrinogen decarboxylase family protein [Sphaerochaetaceae bacterium]|nr:uroporphyrinogen decarboxylase family protein [Sphaerochaetaceae bacterium]